MFRSNKLSITTRAFIMGAMMVVIGPDVRADVLFVSGDVSGVWSADSVIVVDSVRVPAGETLTIMPGVEVLFTSYYRFEVLDGAVLHAVGTESDTIKFLPFTQGDRTLGLDFINASDQSILEYCYFNEALSSGVHCTNSDITIRNTLIENSEAPTGVEGGGAVELLNGSDALIENSVIRDNFSADYGGGIYVSSSSPLIRNNEISGNIAGYYNHAYGGGIAVLGNSSPQIIKNTITNNTAHPTGFFSVNHGGGGGISLSGGTNVLISGNIIAGNRVVQGTQTTSDGGGIYVNNSSPYISNNVIADNEAEGDNGGGVYLYNSDAQLINNTIAYNVANDSGGGAYFEDSNPVLVNLVIYFNMAIDGPQIFQMDSYASVSYSDVEGFWPGEGNLDLDPLFRDAVAGDYHLQAQMCGDQNDSPLIDAGSPDYMDSLLDCSWGLGTELSDIGGYGGGEMTPTSIDDAVEAPSEFLFAYNFPNPFNASTTIRYRLPEASPVTIDIYDMLGRRVETLINNQPHSAGEHQIVWDASENSSGMYFYRLEIDGYSREAKMLLLK